MIYKIHIINCITKIDFTEYYLGKRKAFDRLYFLLNNQEVFEVDYVLPCVFTLKTLKKCLF